MTIDTTPDLEPASSTHASGSVFTSKSRLRAFFEAWPPLVLIALFWVGVIAVVVVGAKWITPYDFMALDLRARLIPRSSWGVTGHIRWEQMSWAVTCCRG
jgi:ABC-type antimicrobial peptide transport system permease subunit